MKTNIFVSKSRYSNFSIDNILDNKEFKQIF